MIPRTVGRFTVVRWEEVHETGAFPGLRLGLEVEDPKDRRRFHIVQFIPQEQLDLARVPQDLYDVKRGFMLRKMAEA